MKKMSVYFLACVVVHSIQGSATIETSPQPEDLPELYKYGMWDQIVKVFGTCATQAELEALRREYFIDKKILNLALGGEKQFDGAQLSDAAKKLLAARDINTDLHLAAMRDDVAFIEKCFKDEKRKNLCFIKTYRGYSPYRIAKERGHQNIVALLEPEKKRQEEERQKAALLRKGIFDSVVRSSSLWKNESQTMSVGFSGPSQSAVMPSAHKLGSVSHKKAICLVMLLLEIVVYFF